MVEAMLAAHEGRACVASLGHTQLPFLGQVLSASILQQIAGVVWVKRQR